MRIITIASLAILAGCMAGGGPSLSPAPDLAPPLSRATANALKYIAISDLATNTVDVLNSSYQRTMTISSGINGPLGNAYDRNGNLYVANWQGDDVAEYDPAGKHVSTYSEGLVNPLGVTVDGNGNVYVADNGQGKPSIVAEYRQGKNKQIASCFTGLLNIGVALDSAGDVFVSGNSSNRGGGYLRIYRHGLAGCHAHIPRITFGGTGGAQIDNKGNFVVTDQLAGVDILPPPFTSIESTIKLTSDSYDIALTKKNDLIFITNADYPYSLVVVATYPEGKYVKTLGPANGLIVPTGVATFP
ncbi:MAG: hypothetical protein WB609_05860 [Candidatus Cybelea sp.]